MWQKAARARTRRRKSYSSAAEACVAPVLLLFISLAISCTVSCAPRTPPAHQPLSCSPLQAPCAKTTAWPRLQEARDLQLGAHALLQLLLLLQLVLERGWQHVGEQAQRNRQQELHEGHHQEDEHGHQAEHVRRRARQLLALAPARAAGLPCAGLSAKCSSCAHSTHSDQAVPFAQGAAWLCFASAHM